MNVLLYGKNAQAVTSLANSEGLTVVKENPNVIITYGGDGTLLSAEQEFPGVPKLPIRDSSVCKKCLNHTDEALLKALAQGKLKTESFDKLQAEAKGQKKLALNEVVITNPLPVHAIRLEIKKNDEVLQPMVVGDGIIAATPFGATGYFHSVTRQRFDQGFGLGFNNPVTTIPPTFFTANDIITAKIIRGPGILAVDNNHDVIELSTSDEVNIKAAIQKAVIYSAENLRCPNCVIDKSKRLD